MLRTPPQHGSISSLKPSPRSRIYLATLSALAILASPAFSADKVIGGEDATSSAYQGQTPPSPVSIDAAEIYDEIIGGHHLKQITNEGASSSNLITAGNPGSSVVINNVSGVQYVIGGSKINNAFANLETTSSSVSISGGTLGAADSGDADLGVIGGNLIKATLNQGGTTARASTQSTSVNISAGTFLGTDIIGGSKANVYGTTDPSMDLSVTDANTRLDISGGDFSEAGLILSGAVADGTGASASVVNSSVELTGGTFKYASRQSVYGGSAALNGATAATETSSLHLVGGDGFALKNGTEPTETGTTYLTLYGGGLNAPTTKLSSLTVEDADLGYIVVSDGQTQTKTVQLYSGSHYEAAGNYEEGDSLLTVSDSTVRGDIRGTSWVGPPSSSTIVTGYVVHAGSSTVNVTNTVMNGYTRGNSTWNGRIFGAGILQYTGASSLTVDSTHVAASGITGVDLEQSSGEVTHNPGVRVFGGGQLYNASNAANQDNTLAVGTTLVELSGADSEVCDVIGGSIVSGTNAYRNNTVKLGSSEVHVTDAYVSGWVLGGNDVNWFGTGSVDGTTAITVDGAARVGTVIGANTATFWGGYMFGAGVREASMTGSTSISITADSTAGMVIGAGYAESSHESGSPSVGDGTTSGRQESDLNSAAVSTLNGDTQVSVSGNAEVGVLVGAGYSWSDANYLIDNELKQTQRANAHMTGTASTNLSGGSVGQWILGGLAEGYGESILEGNAVGTMSAGTVEQVIVGGLGSEVTVFNLNYDSNSGTASLTDSSSVSSGSAGISGDAVLTVTGGALGNVILGGAVSDKDGNIVIPTGEAASDVLVDGTATLIIAGDTDLSNAEVRRGSANAAQLQFGTADSTWNGSFSNFSGIDTLAVNSGSTLTLAHLGADQMGANGITLAGDGQISIQTLDHSEKAVTLSGGTLAVESLAMSGTGSLSITGGTMQTDSSVIFTSGLDDEGRQTNAGDLTQQAKNHVVFEGGSLALTDENYNIHYASSAAGLIGSATEVVFNGTLVSSDETDSTVNTLNVSDYTETEGGIAENAVFASAQLDSTDQTSGSNLTIGKASSTVGNEVVIEQSVGVGSLLLKTDATTITVNDNKVLTLVGNGQNLISGANGAVALRVGDTDADSGTLRLGTQAAPGSGGEINADVQVYANSQILVEAGSFTNTGDISNAGSITVADQAALALAALENTGSVTIEGSMQVDRLTSSDASSAGTIQVGTDRAAGALQLGGETLAGNVIFLDPAWKTDSPNNIDEASRLVSEATQLDGGVIAGRNSWAVLGTSSPQAFLDIFKRSGLTWGPNGITAAAYLAKPVDVTSGLLIVDGSLTTQPSAAADGTVFFGAGSLLAADVSNLAPGEALVSGASEGNVTVDDQSHLILSGVSADTPYQIIEGSTVTWNTANISSANAMFGSAQTDANGAVSFTLQDAATVYGPLMQGHELVNAAMGGGASSADYAYADMLLTQNDGDVARAARRFDAAMNPAGALSVFTNAMDRSSELREAVRDEAQSGLSSRLWARVTGGKTKLKGISSGAQSIHTDTDAYGLTIGTEYGFSTGAVGAAFAAGTGTTDNDDVSGEDDFDYYGLSLYGRTTAAGIDFLADASVTWLKSDLSIGDSADVSTDTTTTVWSIGGQMRKTFAFDWVDVTPFVGVDVYHIESDGFSNGHGAQIQDSDATAVEFPIGAEFARTFDTVSGMRISPRLSLAVVPSAGDTDIDSAVAFAGARSNYNFTFADDIKIRSRLGVSAQKGNFQFGLHAGYDWGNEERQALSGLVNVRYAF